MRKWILFMGFILVTTVVCAQDIPEEAVKYMARGEAAVEITNSDSGYQKAISEFQNAINAAPNWPAPYYNLAMVQEKIGEYSPAIANLKKYLELDPRADDAQMVETHIYKLEYKRDNPVETAQPIYEAVAVSVPVAQSKNYSHLSGEWCRKEYQNICFEVQFTDNTFTLGYSQAIGSYGLVNYTNYSGTINDNGSITGVYNFGASIPSSCAGDVVWHRSPPEFLDGSRLYPGEEEMMLRYNNRCFQIDLSTCEGVDNCAGTVQKIHLIRS